MDLYLKKIDNLKRPNQSQSNVVRSSSVVSRSASPQVERVQQVQEEVKEVKEVRKIVYKQDLVDLQQNLENVKSQLSKVQSDVNDKINALSSQLVVLKNDMTTQQEQNVASRTRDKLNDFINKYNENELSHSDSLKALENELNKIDSRVKVIEDVL